MEEFIKSIRAYIYVYGTEANFAKHTGYPYLVLRRIMRGHNVRMSSISKLLETLYPDDLQKRIELTEMYLKAKDEVK